MLFEDPLPKDAARACTTTGSEKVIAARRELYIHYPEGMGRSKLKIPAKLLTLGTVRNLNTLSKLANLAQE